MLLRTVAVLNVLLASDPRTDQQIAKDAGIDRTTFSKIKNGERAPTEGQVRALAGVLGVHPSVITAQIPRDEIIGALEGAAKSSGLRESPAHSYDASGVLEPATIPGRMIERPYAGTVPAGAPDSRDAVVRSPDPHVRKKKPVRKRS